MQIWTPFLNFCRIKKIFVTYKIKSITKVLTIYNIECYNSEYYSQIFICLIIQLQLRIHSFLFILCLVIGATNYIYWRILSFSNFLFLFSPLSFFSLSLSILVSCFVVRVSYRIMFLLIICRQKWLQPS